MQSGRISNWSSAEIRSEMRSESGSNSSLIGMPVCMFHCVVSHVAGETTALGLDGEDLQGVVSIRGLNVRVHTVPWCHCVMPPSP